MVRAPSAVGELQEEGAEPQRAAPELVAEAAWVAAELGAPVWLVAD